MVWDYEGSLCQKSAKILKFNSNVNVTLLVMATSSSGDGVINSGEDIYSYSQIIQGILILRILK